MDQKYIDLYDRYTHGQMKRRDFLERLAVLAGGATAANALLAALQNNYAQATIIAENDPRLLTEMVSFSVGDNKATGYLAKPTDIEKAPAVIVIHENRGLNPHIRDVARRVALEGFVVLAPDFLSPLGGTPDDEDKARGMFDQLTPGQVTADGTATVAFLAQHELSNGKVGAVGFCWGGGAVNDLAVNAPTLAAGVAYYGRQPKDEDVAKIRAPLLLHYAGLDERINAGIDAFKAALTKDGKEFTIYIYDGVNHAFNNDTSEARYDKAAAELAWGRTIAFFKEKLA